MIITNLSISCTMYKDKTNQEEKLYQAGNLELEDFNSSCEFVASHELRATGVHRLIINCTYDVVTINQIDDSESRLTKFVRKNYDIKIQTPVKITMNYPYLNVRSCIAEATSKLANDVNKFFEKILIF